MENIRLSPQERVSTFRRLAVAAWGPPRDPSIYGSVLVDATPALAWLEGLRARTGCQATVTHLVGRALAVALAERPDLNALIRLGRFYRRVDVDIFFQVALQAASNDPGALDLSGVLVRGADRKPVEAIARELGERLAAVREDRDPELAGARRALGLLPGALLRPLQVALDVLQYSLNLRVPGLPRDPFGSAAVTNVGMYGVTWAYAPLFPPSRSPIVVLVGAITRQPWVVHDGAGERIEVRPVLPLHATFDHRVLDGVQAARLAARIQALLAEPALLERVG